MAEFTPEMKQFAVAALGRGYGPTEVGDMMKETFDLLLAPPSSQLARYNPTLLAGRGLDEDLKALFYEERETAKTDVEAVPLCHYLIRLRELTQLFEAAKKAKNRVEAADLLEQIAKEESRFWTKSGGGPGGGHGAGGGIAGAAGAGSGSGDPDRAAELNSLLDTLRARKAGEAPLEGVPGGDAVPGAAGADQG